MKKFYSFLMLMCLAIGSAWAGSNLFVLGEEVNVSANWTKNASSFVSGASGTISYTTNPMTLKFTNVKIPSSNSKKVVHNKIYVTLKIAIEGECELYSKDKVIQYDATTVLDGSASTSVKMYSMSDEETMYSNESRDDGAANLTISNFRYLEMYSKGDYCISHKYGTVNLKNSHILMQGGKGTIHSNSYAYSSFSRVDLEDCFYSGNYTWLSTGDSRDVATATSEALGEKVKQCVIIRGSEYTGVRLNGIAILTSDSRWNASTNTVTLNANVDASSNFTYEGAITVEKTDVTIDGGGKSFYGKKYGMIVLLRSPGENATIRNMALHGSYAGLHDYDARDFITIEDNVSLYGVDYAIYDGHIRFSPSSGKSVVLMPEPGYSETAYGSMFRQRAIQASSIRLNECSVYPEGITIYDKTLAVGTTPWIQQVIIKGWEKYDLSINGTQVNENNKDNLTSLLGSSATGTLKYNPNTQTLTMNNLQAHLTSSAINGNLIHTLYGNLTIAVEGANTIMTSGSSNVYQMWSHGNNFIIKGTSSTASKLTLKGSQQSAFINADKPVIKDVTLNIEGNGTQNGIESKVVNAEGTISNANIIIKNTIVPLSGRWSSSGVYGYLTNSTTAITIDPTSKKLVYFYDGATAPSADVVTGDIAIYPIGTYTVTVNGSKPGGFTTQQGVCFDEFSRRLYLRNTKFNGKIVASTSALTVYTIGICEVTNDECPFSATPTGLTFTGPGQLTLNAPNGIAAQIIGYISNATTVTIPVNVKNTQLNLYGKMGLYYLMQPNPGILNVTKSTVEAHCPLGQYACLGFSSMSLNDCTLYTPQGGTYNSVLLNVDGSVASDMLILPYAPTTITFDAYANNNLKLESNYDIKVIAKINNFTIKGDHTWRTICLPFDLKIPGSVLRSCDVRELTSIRQKGDVGILDFTKSVIEMKHDIPYLIRNTSSTDIVNPDFGVVRIQGNEESVQDGVVIGYDIVFQGIYAQETDYYYSNLYALQNDLVLVNKKGYTRDAFGAVFFLRPEDANSYVAYTGSSEDDLIDGIDEIKNEESGMKNEATYDLSGRRIDAQFTRPGIYIKNGKKVAVK